MANGIARMVAGGAAGGFDDESVRPSPSDQETRDEIARLIAPKGEGKSKVSDRKASMLMAAADAAMKESVGTLSRRGPAPAPARRGIASTVAPAPRPDEIREDNTLKQQGYFGPVQHSSGKMSTELSIGYGEPTSRAYTHRTDRLYPSMVPTLTREELDAVVGGGEWPDAVYDKARAYGEQRLRQGRSPFAQPGEQYPAPGYEQQFMQQYPSAVMSYPDRTVGYQYAAGAPVTPYMSPVASRPVPQSAIMSMVRRK